MNTAGEIYLLFETKKNKDASIPPSMLPEILLSSLIVLSTHAASYLLVGERGGEEAVWFLQHALVNLMIARMTLSSFVDSLLLMPYCTEEEGAFGRVPISLSICLHAWHAIRFKMTTDDRIHHLLFLPLIGVPGLLYGWGKCGDVQLFFMCGVPGAILYLLLSARRCGWLTGVDEPLVSCAVNLLVRMPGGLFAWYLLARSILDAFLFRSADLRLDPPAWALLLQFTLSPINSIGYTVQSLRRLKRRRRRS